MKLALVVLLVAILAYVVESHGWGGNGWWNRRRWGSEGEGECSRGHHHGPHGEGEGECGHDHSDHGPKPGPFFCGSLFRYVKTQGNTITVAKKRCRQSDIVATFSLQSIVEKDLAGGAIAGHSVALASYGNVVVTAMNYGTQYQGLNACQSTVVFNLGLVGGRNSTVTLDMFLFSVWSGTITDGPMIHDVGFGTVKFIVSVNNWNWAGAGAVLDLTVTAKTPSAFCRSCPYDDTLYAGGCGYYLVLPHDVYSDMAWSVMPNTYPQLGQSLTAASTQNILARFNRFVTSASWGPIYSIATPFSLWRPTCPTKRVKTSSSSAGPKPISSSAKVVVVPSSSMIAPPQPSSSSGMVFVPSSSAAQPPMHSSSDPVFFPSSSVVHPPAGGSSSSFPVFNPDSSSPGQTFITSSHVLEPASSTGEEGDFSSSMLNMMSSSSDGNPGPCDPQDDPDFDPWSGLPCQGACCSTPCRLGDLPKLINFPATIGPNFLYQQPACNGADDDTADAGQICQAVCDPNFVPQAYWQCANGEWWVSRNFSQPCQPIRYAVFELTTNNATGAMNCSIVQTDLSDRNAPFIQSCPGNGVNRVEVQIAIYPGSMPTLPTTFDGNPEPPFLLNYTVRDGPPTSYLNISICRPDFNEPPPVLRLYQSEDFGATWVSSTEVCRQLGVFIEPQFFPIDVKVPDAACWSFPVCHATLFLAGPELITPDGPSATVPARNHVSMWIWVLAGVAVVVVIGLILACARKLSNVNKLVAAGQPRRRDRDAITTNYVMLDDRDEDQQHTTDE